MELGRFLLFSVYQDQQRKFALHCVAQLLNMSAFALKLVQELPLQLPVPAASPLCGSLCGDSSLLEVSPGVRRQLERSDCKISQKRLICNLDAFSAVVYSAAPNASLGAAEWGD